MLTYVLTCHTCWHNLRTRNKSEAVAKTLRHQNMINLSEMLMLRRHYREMSLFTDRGGSICTRMSSCGQLWYSPNFTFKLQLFCLSINSATRSNLAMAASNVASSGEWVGTGRRRVTYTLTDRRTIRLSHHATGSSIAICRNSCIRCEHHGAQKILGAEACGLTG